MDTSIIIFDVETTGIDRATSEVIELAIQYGFSTDGLRAPQTVWRFKPKGLVGSSVDKHGITDEALLREQPFRVHVQRIGEIFDEAEILIAYNGTFDLDMLGAEFARAQYTFPDLSGKTIVDPLRLWHQFEPRTLTAAHQRFVGGEFLDAHSAGADVAATGDVLLGMLRDFGLNDKTWEEISALADPDRKTWLGHSAHLRWVKGVPTFTFGKHKGRAMTDPDVRNYLKWIGGSDFPPHVKEIAREAASRRADAFLKWAAQKYPPPVEPAP